MAHLVELDGVRPTVGDGVFLAPTAVVIGDVTIGDDTGVPVTVKKQLSGSAARWAEMATTDYQELRQRYLSGMAS